MVAWSVSQLAQQVSTAAPLFEPSGYGPCGVVQMSSAVLFRFCRINIKLNIYRGKLYHYNYSYRFIAQPYLKICTTALGYTIMGKTADLTVVQKTIIDTLHKEGKPQTFIAKEAGCSQSAVSKHVNRKLSGRKKVWKKKMHNQPREPQPYEDCQAKSIQEFGWTSQGMNWGWGQGIKSHHTQTCQWIWLQLSCSSC